MLPSLKVSASKKLRHFTVDVDFQIGPQIAVLLGPSGHGKTTVLNMIAGIVPPDSGSIRVGDTCLYDSSARHNIGLEKRNIGYVFQDYALFPHLSVFENVCYGLKARGLPSQEVLQRTMRSLERLAIAELKDEMPNRLSGGQRQRVALARALVIEPCLLLMDEPLSALDMQLRAHVRSDLKALLRELGIPTIIVTHDALDAVSLGDVVMVMEQGKIVQQGTYETLLANPSSRFVAEFIESNAYTGTLKSIDEYGAAIVILDGGVEVHAVIEEGNPETVLAVIHPWDVTLSKRAEIGSIRNVLDGRILSICPLRDRIRVRIEAGIQITAEISRESLESLHLREGGQIYAGVKTTSVRIFPL